MTARSTPDAHRRRVLRAGAAGGLALAGLPARACEFWTPTLRVTHPWTRAAADDDTTAIVCMRFDEVRLGDRLIGAETMLAERVELAGAGVGPAIDFAIPAGRETQLSERGTHLLLVGLKLPLALGRSYPLQLRFAEGGELQAELSVDYMRFR